VTTENKPFNQFRGCDNYTRHDRQKPDHQTVQILYIILILPFTLTLWFHLTFTTELNFVRTLSCRVISSCCYSVGMTFTPVTMAPVPFYVPLSGSLTLWPVSAILELLLVEDLTVSPEAVTIYNHPNVRVRTGACVKCSEEIDRNVSYRADRKQCDPSHPSLSKVISAPCIPFLWASTLNPVWPLTRLTFRNPLTEVTTCHVNPSFSLPPYHWRLIDTI
jgi:hypothetical protein